MIDLRRIVKMIPRAKYSDFKMVECKETQVALRPESSEVFENSSEKIICRVIDKGYGVAGASKIDGRHAEMVSRLALKQAKVAKGRMNLHPVKPEVGQVKYPERKEFNIEEANRLLLDIRNELRARLGALYERSELILSHYHIDSALVTSEGTCVEESVPFTDLTIYLVVREILQGFASRILGGKGGLEILEGRDWNRILNDLVSRAKDMLGAKLLSPLERGRGFKVVFDSEAAGAFAHEVAHLLEADVFQEKFFKNLNVPEDLVIEDNPMIPGAYGSFTWDDEGVRGVKKTLLKRGEIGLLHTRLTAGEGEIPGNAHGITHMPRPTVSNVYIGPSDWRLKEIFEDTRNGIYVRSLVRAEVDTSDGKFELIPEIAYLINKKELKTPIKHLKVADSIKNAIQRIDAIGKLATLRPNVEKGFCISEGGPHIRIDGVCCL
ncbi:MAG: TldD/PmbA family protein [archaeon]|nr:TldD/PmbA family protein [archaeon]